MRNNMDAAEYEDLVLGLIFLECISDAFEEKHAALMAEAAAGADPEDQDEYRADNIFWVPKAARWPHLRGKAKQPTIGKLVDDAMVAIERDNATLKVVLPKKRPPAWPPPPPASSALKADIYQHRVRTWDWDDDWIFEDARIDLLGLDDDTFLHFVAEMAHPVVRPETQEPRDLVLTFNQHLIAAGWELAEAEPVSGRPTLVGRRLTAAGVALLEAALDELEVRLLGQNGHHKGNLQRLYAVVARQLRMYDQRPDLEERFKQVVRGLLSEFWTAGAVS